MRDLVMPNAEVARDFDVLFLILADGDEVGIVNQNVRRHSLHRKVSRPTWFAPHIVVAVQRGHQAEPMHTNGPQAA